MVCFAAIATKEGKIFYEHSSSIQLPIKLQNAIETNVDVDSVLDESTVHLHKSHTGRESLKYLKKREFIYECVNAVMLRYCFDDKLY